MMSVLFPILFFLIFRLSSCHYVFVNLIVNETVFPEWAYIRKFDPLALNNSSGQGMFGPYIDPLYDYESPNLRCNRGAYRNGADTETATVIAGSQIGFKVGLPGFNSTQPVEVIGHPGPGSVWLSKTDDELNEYEGDGEWFKIAQVVERGKEERGNFSPSDRKFDWALYAKPSWNFTIPSSTPPGKYLLRIEHMYPRAPVPSQMLNNGTQWYISCAQIHIIGNGGGFPAPMVKIPGIYQARQSNVFFDYQAKGFHIEEYKPPAPPVWED